MVFFKGCLPKISLTTLQASETTASYDKQVEFLSILHEAILQ